MKKAFLIMFICSMLLMVSGCGANKPPYSIEQGAYEMDKAIITNLITKEVTEKLFDDIINDKTEYLEWGWLFSFSVGINQDTEFTYKDNRCFILNEGLAYELIGNNTLKLHFPRWQGYDYGIYDVVIILGKHKLYG